MTEPYVPTPRPSWRRIVFKPSGEALAGESGTGLQLLRAASIVTGANCHSTGDGFERDPEIAGPSVLQRVGDDFLHAANQRLAAFRIDGQGAFGRVEVNRQLANVPAHRPDETHGIRVGFTTQGSHDIAYIAQHESRDGVSFPNVLRRQLRFAA